jgi:pyruvate ferredoxin oxidoreductase beta subunit
MTSATTPLTLKELSKKPELLAGGHRLCAGCLHSVIVRQVLHAAEQPVIASTATGCLEVATSIQPFSAWRIPWIHSAFENAAATASGLEAMYQSLKKQGKLPTEADYRFIAFGGDGGTYDIGLQSLSGALERGHRMLYVCCDNGAYMNTGIQRSSATPMGASTTTSPAGKVIPGKLQWRKDLTRIVAAHNIPYVAQASPHNWLDLMKKVRKALAADGPSFINVISTCHRGWRSKPSQAVATLRPAVDSCYWPLYEIEDGVLKITYKPKTKVPVTDWLKLQGRFAHLFKPEPNTAMLEAFQARVDHEWERLQKQEQCGL